VPMIVRMERVQHSCAERIHGPDLGGRGVAIGSESIGGLIIFGHRWKTNILYMGCFVWVLADTGLQLDNSFEARERERGAYAKIGTNIMGSTVQAVWKRKTRI
jgi:hypothetical protein